MATATLGPKLPRGKSRRKGSSNGQNFSAYLTFGLPVTACVACFFMAYVLVLLCLLPMLDEANQVSDSLPAGPLEGARIPHAPAQERIVQAASAGHEKFAQAASAVKVQLRKIRQGRGVTDESLLNAAQAEFDVVRARKRLMNRKQLDTEALSGKKNRRGFFILGMHRSGTSMLSGLLVTGMKYNVGAPLIGPSFDNEKGFFERIDVVLQNDEFFTSQKMGWSYNVINFNSERALQHKEEGKVTFKEGAKALQFLNNPSNSPWLQKDPRMCITLGAWLKLLNSDPAVVFTYRHPLEVAKSLNKREKNFGIDRGLRLWIVYNMRAIQNSSGLCRVFSSNEAILADPLKEVQRISDGLTTQCGVPSPPGRLSQKVVDMFVDPKLHHNKETEEAQSKRKVLANHEGCVVQDFDSTHPEGSQERKRETDLYLKAMKVYCDFQSGNAYNRGYEWPQLL